MEQIYADLLRSYIHLLMNILASDAQIEHIEIVTEALSTKKVNHENFNMLPFINISSFKDWVFRKLLILSVQLGKRKYFSG